MSFFKSIMDSLKLSDDSDYDDLDDYDSYVAAEEKKEKRRQQRRAEREERERERAASAKAAPLDDYADTPAPATRSTTGRGSSLGSSSRSGSSFREQRNTTAAAASSARFSASQSYESQASQRTTMGGNANTSGKLTSMNRSGRSAMEVSIMKPTSFEDAQDICDTLLGGKPIIVNLEGFDLEKAQRVMDFVSGCVYSINGKLHQISGFIFILSPNDVDVSGDYLALMRQDGFGVPTFNKMF